MGYVSLSKRCLVIKECIEVWVANFPPQQQQPPTLSDKYMTMIQFIHALPRLKCMEGYIYMDVRSIT